MATFHCKVTWAAPTVDEGGNGAVIQKYESSRLIYRAEIYTFSCSFMDKPILFHLVAHVFNITSSKKSDVIDSPIIIPHPPQVRGDPWLLRIRCVQYCISVCCLCMCVYILYKICVFEWGDKLLLTISQVTLTFISSRHWKLMWHRYTHTNTRVNSNELHSDRMMVV